MTDDWTVEAIVARLAATDLRGPTLEVAAALPCLYRELRDALGPAEARRRFDAALQAVLVPGAA